MKKKGFVKFKSIDFWKENMGKYYKRAKALFESGKFSEAEIEIKLGLKLAGAKGDPELEALLVQIKAKLPKGDAEKGAEFIAEKLKEPQVRKMASEMCFEVLSEGTGDKSPNESDQCEVHYEGTLIDGTKFDSSYDRGRPSSFAPNQVIKGWTEALQCMVEGSKWKVYLPSEIAYGEQGYPPQIPGGATLVFSMELLKVMGGGKSAAEAKALLASKEVQK